MIMQQLEKTVLSGRVEYRLNGILHREDGPAVEYDNGGQWYVNGKQHREDGPATILSNGTKYWFFNSFCHRLDGPALEYANGHKYWFVNGFCYLGTSSFNNALMLLNHIRGKYAI